MPHYKLFDHTADIGIEITGRTEKDLFANAAFALFDVMIENNKSGEETKGAVKRRKTITIEGLNSEDLLINFLRELLYQFNGENFVVRQCEILEFGDKKIKARLTGEMFNKSRHAIKMEIKAVTYGGLKVERFRDGWRARVIFDV